MRYNSKRHRVVGRQKPSARPLQELNEGLGVSPHKQMLVIKVLVVLCQKHDNSIKYAIGYASKAFSGAKLDWHTEEKEAYTILFGIEHFRVYLHTYMDHTL
jgi:hypothetical protein